MRFQRWFFFNQSFSNFSLLLVWLGPISKKIISMNSSVKHHWKNKFHKRDILRKNIIYLHLFSLN